MKSSEDENLELFLKVFMSGRKMDELQRDLNKVELNHAKLCDFFFSEGFNSADGLTVMLYTMMKLQLVGIIDGTKLREVLSQFIIHSKKLEEAMKDG